MMNEAEGGSGAAPGGTVLRASGKDGPQRIRVNGKWWNDEAETIFLDHLAASCNVSWSAAEAGFSTVTVYNHRRTDPAFAAKWEAALEQGYLRLETELVGTATAYLDRLKLDPDLPLKAMSVRDAISLLGMHRTRGIGTGPGRFMARPRSLDEVRDSILAKFEAIEAARLAEAEGGEAEA